MPTGHLLWLASKHSNSPTPSDSAILHDRDRGMLRGGVHILERRRRIRSNPSRRRFLDGLVRAPENL